MAGTETIAAFLEAFAAPGGQPKKLHVVGHSTGAILLAALLTALSRANPAPRIQTCLLLAPACTHGVFNQTFRPLLRERDTTTFGIGRMAIYTLEDDLEKADTVTPLYRKSLLYLVSHAFEEKRGERILGMQSFARSLGRLPNRPVFRIERSNGATSGAPKTTSRTHGGFDNDVRTMNDVLRAALRKPPSRPFTEGDLRY